MGVDKDNVGLVVHYEISDSLENYVQEAGRAGRNESINADCYVLFNDNDLDRHFTLLTQTKLSLNEIQQVWRAVKELSRQRDRFTRTPLEIARTAGWDENIANLETKVKTAIAALENAGYNLNESLMGNVLKIPVLKTESNYRELLEKYGFENTAAHSRDFSRE